jgi:hypothetical protein
MCVELHVIPVPVSVAGVFVSVCVWSVRMCVRVCVQLVRLRVLNVW